MSRRQLILCGHGGRMGKMLGELNEVAKVFTDIVKFPAPGEVEDVAAVMDFSSPEGFRSALEFSVKKNLPFVSGTTGLSDRDFVSLDEASHQIPLLWAANMSLGIQWFKKAIQTLAPLSEAYEFQIEETHHKRKLDCPSGTAKDLQVALESTTKKRLPAPVAIRGGGVFGVHRLFILGEEETMTVEHVALDRRVFARGALKAAEFLLDKPPGRYTMGHVLGFNE